jgi:tetratricopeptide (TPR) repeat protein
VRRRLLAVLTAVAAGASIGAAQAPPLLSDRAARAMPGSYSDPLCELKGTHYKTTAAIENLKNALEATDTAKRTRELAKGREVLLDAITKNKQGKSSTAWFTLGRIYLYQGDVVGADSALTHAQEISPKCAGTFQGLRYQVWLPVMNAASEFAKANRNDSALALFRQAAAIDPSNPQAAMGAGVILANGGQTDSAIADFQSVARLAERARMLELRNQATLNLALMLQRANRHPAAVAAFEQYLGWMPNDVEAKRALAVSYRATGEKEKAERLDQVLLQGSGGSKAGGGPPADPDEAMRVGITYYNEKQWAEAARAFELAVAAAPYNRDALYALSNSYLALEDGPKLVQAAEKLVTIEPLNLDALKLLGAGYRKTNQSREALQVAERIFGLGVDVAIQGFTVSADTVTVTGTATGRAAQTAKGKAIPPAATALEFEFLDGKGNVVDSASAQIPALKPSVSAPVSIRTVGKGIVGWRYRRA